MSPCVISPSTPYLEPEVGSVGTIGLCGIGFCIKFSPLSRLEPGAGSVGINIIGHK